MNATYLYETIRTPFGRYGGARRRAPRRPRRTRAARTPRAHRSRPGADRCRDPGPRQWRRRGQPRRGPHGGAARRAPHLRPGRDRQPPMRLKPNGLPAVSHHTHRTSGSRGACDTLARSLRLGFGAHSSAPHYPRASRLPLGLSARASTAAFDLRYVFFNAMTLLSAWHYTSRSNNGHRQLRNALHPGSTPG